VTSPEATGRPLERHVVLVAPQIHWNTGNIGRTCLGVGACLHLIAPLGFSLDHRSVKRAGLDYWDKVDLTVWNDFDAFESRVVTDRREVVLLTKSGTRDHWDMPIADRLVLVFGSETAGLPRTVLERYPDAHYRIPTTGAIRSLNLSTAAGIVLYETLRPKGESGLGVPSPAGPQPE
jgi:tRNA (cytidine/uridine-2'-O-)-methyltransferase